MLFSSSGVSPPQPVEWTPGRLGEASESQSLPTYTRVATSPELAITFARCEECYAPKTTVECRHRRCALELQFSHKDLAALDSNLHAIDADVEAVQSEVRGVSSQHHTPPVRSQHTTPASISQSYAISQDGTYTYPAPAARLSPLTPSLRLRTLTPTLGVRSQALDTEESSVYPDFHTINHAAPDIPCSQFSEITSSNCL
ncbi:hypothetical protein BV22DRAFT_1126768 [Leucogyrophana mollusca]|uniref:Uncharacterized protein n=1 Tax=Leucogyrophana mollusca TaxID=85980 RepID=A0ACB8BQG9_9AGAM|nr:hypothetical protein BV22DRAFT_1126768 [Leucogyrophana mollusca]